jgi:hypothetical protein
LLPFGYSMLSSRSLLFKYARDVEIGNEKFLYGGIKRDDDCAMKAASNELVACNYYAKFLPLDIELPNQCLVDYLGHRIVAMALLPINKTTLVYGSSNAGVEIHQDDTFVNEALKAVAGELFLSAHLISGKMMFSAGDIEAHKVPNESMYFLLDMSRAFPPESPKVLSAHFKDILPTAIFSKHFRPEFLLYLKQNADKLPFELGDGLSPDALSRWGKEDSELHNTKVENATQYLVDVRCKELAMFLHDLGDSKLEDTQISSHFHRFGVGMRYLGVVTSYLPEDSQVSLRLFENMLARCIKVNLRMSMREIREKGWSSTGNSFNAVRFICDWMNDLLHIQSEKEVFFKEVASKFGVVFEGLSDKVPITHKIILSAFDCTGIALTPASHDQLVQSIEKTALIPADVAFTYSNVRALSFVKEAKAVYSAFALRKTAKIQLTQGQMDRISAVAESIRIELQRDDFFIKQSFLQDLEEEFMASKKKVSNKNVNIDIKPGECQLM